MGDLLTDLNEQCVRVIYYLINTFALSKTSLFDASDWEIYVFPPIFSMGGVMAGGKVLIFSGTTKRSSRVY